MWFFKKINPRRGQVRKTLAAERASRMRKHVDAEIANSCLLWLLFVVLCVFILAFEFDRQVTSVQTVSIGVIVVIISVATAFYIHLYQQRIIKNHARAVALSILFIFFAITITLAGIGENHTSLCGTQLTSQTAPIH